MGFLRVPVEKFRILRPVIEVFNLHHRGWSPVDEDAKNTLGQGIFGDILLGNVMLAITGFAINQWNLVFWA
jgi:hypothetical protein